MPPRKKVSVKVAQQQAVGSEEASQNSVGSSGLSMKDTQYEINRTFNDLTRELFMVSELEESKGAEVGEVAAQVDTQVDINKVNVHVINQVVALIAGSDLQPAKKRSKNERAPAVYPPKLVQQSFIAFLERVLTLTTKDANLKPLFKAVDTIFTRLGHQKLLEDRAHNSYQLVQEAIDFLAGVCLVPNVDSVVKLRAALMLSQVLRITTASSFRMTDADTVAKVERAAIDMLWSSQNQSMQLFGVQIGSILSKTKDGHKRLIFPNMVRALQVSKYKEVRRLAIRLIKVPQFVQHKLDPEDSNFEEKARMKKTLIRCFGMRLMDQEPAVRREAYVKLTHLNVKIEDFDCPETRMLIFKEGMTDQDTGVKAACIHFLTPSIVEEVEVEVEQAEFESKAKMQKDLNTKRRRSNISLIAKNSREPHQLSAGSQDEDDENRPSSQQLYRDSQGQEHSASRANSQLNDENAEERPSRKMRVVKRVYNFSKLLEQIDIKHAFINEYFVQVPMVIMAAFFKVALNQQEQWRGNTDLTAELKELNDQDPEIIIANYAEMLLEKFKRLARGAQGCRAALADSGTHLSNKFEQYEIDDHKIKFEEVLFIRILFEFSKSFKQERSVEFTEKIDEIVPEFDDYQQIFKYFLTELPPDPETGSTQENRLILSEWLKFSLQLNIQDETIRYDLSNLIFGFIGQIEHTYADYEYLLKGGQMHLTLSNEEIDDDEEMAEVEGDVQDQVDEDDSTLTLEIRSFNVLRAQKDTQEYMKPFSFEMFVRDSDDVCQVAVTIAKKLHGEDGSSQFSMQMLQTISDIREPLEERNQNLEAEVEVQQRAGFGLHTQVPQGPANQRELLQSLSFKELRQKYQQKLESKVEEIHQYGEGDDSDDNEMTRVGLNKCISKTKRYVSIIEEITLKEKLTLKRSLNLCLILLKQCRANVNDKNLVDICVTIIQPALQATDDRDNLVLAIESIGLLSLLDKDLFENYSRIFSAILADAANNAGSCDDGSIIETLIALKSSIDGLICHGTSEVTEDLQQVILQYFMFSSDKRLRQVTVEGVCKMLFSSTITKGLGKPKQLKDEADKEESPQNDGIICIISQLLIQWFDKKFNWQKSLIRQALQMFFKTFILFSAQRCKVMLQALVRVAYSILTSKYIEDIEKKKKAVAGKPKDKRKNKRQSAASSPGDEEKGSCYSPDPRLQENLAGLDEICSGLDIIHMSRVFLIILSPSYLSENAPSGIRMKMCLNAEYLINLCHMNNTIFHRVQIVKEVIAPIAELLNLQEISDVQVLQTLREQVDKCKKQVLNGLPKLNKFIAAIETRIEELKNLLIDGIDHQKKEEEEEAAVSTLDQIIIPQEELESFYETQIEEKFVQLITDDEEDFQMFINDDDSSNGRGHGERSNDMMTPRASLRADQLNDPSSRQGSSRSSRLRAANNVVNSRSPGRSARTGSYSAAANGSRAIRSQLQGGLGQIPELEESDVKQQASNSSERPRKLNKLVRFPDIEAKADAKSNNHIDGEMAEVEEISETSGDDDIAVTAQIQSNKSQLTRLSKTIASTFKSDYLRSKQKPQGSATKGSFQNSNSQSNINTQFPRSMNGGVAAEVAPGGSQLLTIPRPASIYGKSSSHSKEQMAEPALENTKGGRGVNLNKTFEELGEDNSQADLKIDLIPEGNKGQDQDPADDDGDSDDGPDVFGFMESKLEQQKRRNRAVAPKSNKLGKIPSKPEPTQTLKQQSRSRRLAASSANQSTLAAEVASIIKKLPSKQKRTGKENQNNSNRPFQALSSGNIFAKQDADEVDEQLPAPKQAPPSRSRQNNATGVLSHDTSAHMELNQSTASAGSGASRSRAVRSRGARLARNAK